MGKLNSKQYRRLLNLLPYFNDVVIARDIGVSREYVRQVRIKNKIPKMQKIKQCNLVVNEGVISQVYKLCCKYPFLGPYIISEKLKISIHSIKTILRILGYKTTYQVRSPIWFDFCDLLESKPKISRKDFRAFIKLHNLSLEINYVNSLYRWKRLYMEGKNEANKF